jgi:hypothetical protein
MAITTVFVSVRKTPPLGFSTARQTGLCLQGLAARENDPEWRQALPPGPIGLTINPAIGWAPKHQTAASCSKATISGDIILRNPLTQKGGSVV